MTTPSFELLTYAVACDNCHRSYVVQVAPGRSYLRHLLRTGWRWYHAPHGRGRLLCRDCARHQARTLQAHYMARHGTLTNPRTRRQQS